MIGVVAETNIPTDIKEREWFEEIQQILEQGDWDAWETNISLIALAAEVTMHWS